MPRRNNRLIFLLLTVFALLVYWGCSQPDDVLTGISNTRVTLTAERLPTLPGGLAYELWAANDDEAVSLGKFLYDHELVKFTNLDGGEITGEFMLDEDIFNYDFVFVSVETVPDDDVSMPGPIMLADAVYDPEVRPMYLMFPNADSLWRATVRYNMEAVSDNDRYQNDGEGLWFTTYQDVVEEYQDTVGMTYTVDSSDVFDTLDTIYVTDTLTGDTLDIQYVRKPEAEFLVAQAVGYSNIRPETTKVVFERDTLILNMDSLMHIGTRFTVDSVTDTIPPYQIRDITLLWETLPSFNVHLDIFSQDEFNLPDLSAFGWKYKGWAVFVPDDNDLWAALPGRLNGPAWRYNSALDENIPGDTGVLISTGTFTHIDQPDDANPYVVSDRVPQYPGEDFLNTTALQDSFGIDQINLMPSSDGNVGTVFITLEPMNFVSDSNFPLFVMIEAMPDSRDDITNTFVQVNMKNWTQALQGDYFGFPRVTVDLERF